MFKNLSVVYFSPTGGVKKAALCLAGGLAENITEIDISGNDDKAYGFGEGDAVLFAVPVFGGRIPAFAAGKIKNFSSRGALVVTVVVYGNRAYEDALLELNDLTERQGFIVAASAALIAMHSMAPDVAQGRPDAADEEVIKGFVSLIAEKIGKGGALTPVKVPGGRPYREWTPMPVTPAVSESCTFCGVCALMCPVFAIPVQNPGTTLGDKCILCMRCVAVCPRKSRSLPAFAEAAIGEKLAPFKDMRKENELFI